MKPTLTYTLLLLWLLILPLPACAQSYSAKPITARVVNAQTKQPLEGVIVVSHWELQGGLEGGYSLGELMVLEAVTDGSGTFHFPAWGPKSISSGLASNARLQDLDPQLLLFKSGYTWEVLNNHKSMEQLAGKGPELRSSDYDGKTIELKKFEGSLEEYGKQLAGFGIWLSPFENGCTWKGIPRMVRALDEETTRVGHLMFVIHLKRGETDYARQGCGSVKEFLQRRDQ